MSDQQKWLSSSSAITRRFPKFPAYDAMSDRPAFGYFSDI
jgi:hypothetical protein